MTDLGELKYFLGIHVTRDWKNKTLTINQKNYIRSILKRFDMLDTKPVSTPIATGSKLLKTTEEDEKVDQKRYQSMVGSQMYAMICTRPDIAYAVQQVSQFSSNPSNTHLQAAKRVLRYLVGTSTAGITFSGSSGRSSEVILGYCDADHGAGEDRKSISGQLFTLAGGAM